MIDWFSGLYERSFWLGLSVSAAIYLAIGFLVATVMAKTRNPLACSHGNVDGENVGTIMVLWPFAVALFNFLRNLAIRLGE